VVYDGFVNGQKIYSVTDPRGSEGIIDSAHPISPSTGHEREYDPYNTVRIRVDGSRDTIISDSKLTDLVFSYPTPSLVLAQSDSWVLTVTGTRLS
jgi:hypothetical protein